MSRTIGVALGNAGRRVGLLRYNQDGRRESAAFEYDPEWLTAADRFPIDPSLPLVAGPQYHRKGTSGSVFHNVIADAEPDGWARKVILRDHAKRRAIAKETGATQPPITGALGFLLEVDDFSRVGALRFCDESGVFRRAQEPGRRTAPPLLELGQILAASQAVENNAETEADLAYLRGRGTSLQGLRPKCSVLDEAGHLSIGKFPSVRDERAVTKGEILALTLASDAGINAADGRLVFSDDLPVALIRRFDRVDGERLMYVSAATLMGVAHEESPESSYTEIVDAMRRYGAAPQADIEELWRRIALNILITNVDDHLHNHGFLHVERESWRLAPAFDINPFPDRVRELKTWIGDDTGPAASIEALMSVVPYFRLGLGRAREILSEVETAVSGWREQGLRLGMSKAELDQFSEAFEHSEREAAKTEAAR